MATRCIRLAKPACRLPLGRRLVKPAVLPIRSCTPRHFHASAFSHAQHSSNSNDEYAQMLGEMAKNPKARAVFEAIRNDPALLHKVQELGFLLQRKGYIDPSNPTKQPGRFPFAVALVLSHT